MSAADHDLWVFAYGSLMWRPDFPHVEARPARLVGYRRCFCIYSVHHRGTPERVGLVLGLDRGGTCDGIAYRVAAADAGPTVRALRAREQINGVYREAHVLLELRGAPPEEVIALAYIVERAHPNYAGRLPVALQARLIKAARGASGANLDYLTTTVRRLAEVGIRERELERVQTLVGLRSTVSAAAAYKRISPTAAGLLRSARSRPPAVRRTVKKAEMRRFLHRQRLGA